MDICDGQIAGKLVTQSQIALSVALGQFNGPVYVCHRHSVVGDVLDASRTTAALQTGFEFRVDSGPNFDAGAVLYEISLGSPCYGSREGILTDALNMEML